MSYSRCCGFRIGCLLVCLLCVGPVGAESVRLKLAVQKFFPGDLKLFTIMKTDRSVDSCFAKVEDPEGYGHYVFSGDALGGSAYVADIFSDDEYSYLRILVLEQSNGVDDRKAYYFDLRTKPGGSCESKRRRIDTNLVEKITINNYRILNAEWEKQRKH